ncbi:MAG: hypothetical protein J6Z02_08290 [Lachnospiraceae bacterium]|nr:hypothetical protein [Lachnospiraceae bacterium]
MVKQTGLLIGSYAYLIIVSLINSLHPQNELLSSFKEMMVAAAFLTAVLFWGVAVYRRVMQKKIRSCLIASCVVMTCWLIIKTIKYYIVKDPLVTRLLWYMFYAALLFLPLAGLTAAIYVGTKENYKPKPVFYSVHFITTLLFLVVFTNERHELVFKFIDADADKYTYGFFYYVIVTWILLLVGAMLYIIYKKCIIKGIRKRIVFPLTIVGIGLLYTALYVSGVLSKIYINIDVTTMFCALTMSLWESLIQAGFIRANIGYEKVFKNTPFAARITDNDYNVRFSSKYWKDVPASAYKESEKEEVYLDENTRLKNIKIRSGHFLWTEDVSMLNRTLEALAETKRELSENNNVLNAEIEIKKRIAAVNMQSKLYDQIAEELKEPINELDMLIKNNAGSAEGYDEILKRTSVYGAYIKRRSNLIILGQNSSRINAKELELCISESVGYIRDTGCDARLKSDVSGQISLKVAKRVYDTFEEIIKEKVFSSKEIDIELKVKNEIASLKVDGGDVL